MVEVKWIVRDRRWIKLNCIIVTDIREIFKTDSEKVEQSKIISVGKQSSLSVAASLKVSCTLQIQILYPNIIELYWIEKGAELTIIFIVF